MTASNGVLLQFGTPAAERAAIGLKLVAWFGPIALLAYMSSTEHLGAACMAWMLGSSACPNTVLARPARSPLVEPWITAALGGVALPLSLVWAPHEVWLALSFCCMGWGEWLDSKDQQRGVRSSWRLVSAALAIAALGTWLWLRLQPTR